MCSRAVGRSPVGPRQCRFQLRSGPEEQVLSPVCGDELHADREALVAEVDAERDGRLASHWITAAIVLTIAFVVVLLLVMAVWAKDERHWSRG